MIWRSGVLPSAGQRSVASSICRYKFPPRLGAFQRSFVLLPQSHMVFSGADDSCFKAWDLRDLSESGHRGPGEGDDDPPKQMSSSPEVI